MNSGIRLAQVVRMYPGRADVLDWKTGWRSPKVPILSWGASTDTGQQCTPTPSPAQTEYPLSEPLERKVIAVLGDIDGSPVILGFLPPVDTQMLFSEPDRYINRLGSDVYATGDAAGNIELAHPSGTMVRIGEDPEHEDLTGRDYNQAWKITRNTGRAPHLRILLANAGQVVADVHINPDGAVRVKGAKVTIDAPEAETTGNLTVAGTLTAGVDVQAAGVSLATHFHNGVTAGNAATAPPTPTQP